MRTAAGWKKERAERSVRDRAVVIACCFCSLPLLLLLLLSFSWLSLLSLFLSKGSLPPQFYSLRIVEGYTTTVYEVRHTGDINRKIRTPPRTNVAIFKLIFSTTEEI